MKKGGSNEPPCAEVSRTALRAGMSQAVIAKISPRCRVIGAIGLLAVGNGVAVGRGFTVGDLGGGVVGITVAVVAVVIIAVTVVRPIGCAGRQACCDSNAGSDPAAPVPMTSASIPVATAAIPIATCDC